MDEHNKGRSAYTICMKIATPPSYVNHMFNLQSANTEIVTNL
jgi:hypothetical protein